MPTGRRQTSWLMTKHDGVYFGTTENKSSQWQRGGLEAETSGLQVQRPNHYATPPPRLIIMPHPSEMKLSQSLHPIGSFFISGGR